MEGWLRNQQQTYMPFYVFYGSSYDLTKKSKPLMQQIGFMFVEFL